MRVSELRLQKAACAESLEEQARKAAQPPRKMLARRESSGQERQCGENGRSKTEAVVRKYI